MRIWGFPVMKLWHLPGPDDPPPNMTDPALVANRESRRLAEQDRAAAAVSERLDVPAERRPWDRTEPPPPPPAGPRRIEIEGIPHCDGRHAIREGVQRCEWCDALADLIGVVKGLETQVAILGREQRALRERLTQREARS